MALGASSGDVKRLLLGEGVRTTAIGAGIGLLLAAGLGKLRSGLLYRVSPFDSLVPSAMMVLSPAISQSPFHRAHGPARIA